MRKHLGDGRYFWQKMHHSWNSAHGTTPALLINVTRQSDHHSSPGRPFPLLQSPREDDAPRVRAGRRQSYPDITDGGAYDEARNP